MFPAQSGYARAGYSTLHSKDSTESRHPEVVPDGPAGHFGGVELDATEFRLLGRS
jgi:hypothetical protein